jgi:tRNA (guanine-N7-)-methyltransferase
MKDQQETVEQQETVQRERSETPNRPVNAIRSFVLRQTRMTKHQREAYERLSPVYCIPMPHEGSEPIDYRAHFPEPSRPLVLEIGFGMGETTATIAEAMQETNFVGVDVHKPGVGKLLGQIEKRDLRNLRLVHGDVIPLLQQYTAPECFDGVHIFFPDPWPKKRHHKRRLIQPSFVHLLTEKMRAGAYLYVVTDWADYADQILEVLNGAAVLVNRYEGFAPTQQWRPQTAFEQKGLSKEHRIYELYFTRSG